MDFNQAYFTIVNASIEQDTKEIPLLLKTTDFKDKVCLEIGAGPLARISIKLLNSKSPPKYITCLDLRNTEKINKLVKQQKLEEKLSAITTKDPLRLPFEDNSFDIVYAGWIPSDLLKNPDYLNELARVSKKHILIIMSGEKGDIPTMRKFVLNQDESKKRQEIKQNLINHFQRLGYETNTKNQTTLKLDFPDLNTIFNTFHFFDFKNQLSEKEQEKLKDYLKDKIHNFKDNLYIFHAEK